MFPYIISFLSDPTQMGGLSMLLLAGEHALTAQEVSNYLYCLIISLKKENVLIGYITT